MLMPMDITVCGLFAVQSFVFGLKGGGGGGSRSGRGLHRQTLEGDCVFCFRFTGDTVSVPSLWLAQN